MVAAEDGPVEENNGADFPYESYPKQLVES